MYRASLCVLLCSLCALSKSQTQPAACTTPKPNCSLCSTVTIELQFGPMSFEVCTTCNAGFAFDSQQQCVARCTAGDNPYCNVCTDGPCTVCAGGFHMPEADKICVAKCEADKNLQTCYTDAQIPQLLAECEANTGAPLNKCSSTSVCGELQKAKGCVMDVSVGCQYDDIKTRLAAVDTWLKALPGAAAHLPADCPPPTAACGTEEHPGCQNDGVCWETNSDEGYACTCPPSHTGKLCQTGVNECEQTPDLCQNGGQCYDLPDAYFCNCPLTHTGQRCEFTCSESIQGCLECFLPVCLRCEDSLMMSADNTACQTCSQAIANCATCSGGKCTACQTGYQLSADGTSCTGGEGGGAPTGGTVLGDDVISRSVSVDGNVGMRIPNPRDYFPTSGTITEFRYYSTGASERIAFFAVRGLQELYRYQAYGITWHTPTQAGLQVVPANIPVRAYDGFGYFHTGPNVIPYDVVQCGNDHSTTRTAWRVIGDVRDDTGYTLRPENRCLDVSLQVVLTPNQ